MTLSYYLHFTEDTKPWCQVAFSLAQSSCVDTWIYMQGRKHGGSWVMAGCPGPAMGWCWGGGGGGGGGQPRAELWACEGPVLSPQLPSWAKPHLPGSSNDIIISTLRHRNHQYHMAASKGSSKRLNTKGKIYNCLYTLITVMKTCLETRSA